MQFSYIDARVHAVYDLAFILREKLAGLALELGCRENNEHVGSGMGGNPSQLILLMDMRHILSGDLKNKIRIDSVNREVIWGYRWFQDKSRKTIRLELNEQFRQLSDCYKERAADLVSAFGAQNICNFIYNTTRFQRLVPLLSAEGNIDGLTPTDQLMVAAAVCQKLAKQLDANDTVNMAKVGKFISQFNNEVILMAVRMHIKIDRLVKFNMDEHPDWKPVLNKINSLVESR